MDGISIYESKWFADNSRRLTGTISKSTSVEVTGQETHMVRATHER